MIRSQIRSAPGLDYELLAEHASYSEDGITEEAGHFSAGAGHRLFSILYRPASPRDEGFVICHSYGLEFLTLRRTERAIARTLASLGYPVISFHARGFGDSTGSFADTTLTSEVEDVETAIEALRTATGVKKVGLAGAKFGGLIAGHVAQRGGINRLILPNAALSGSGYFRSFMREAMLVRVVSDKSGEQRSLKPTNQALDEHGVVDVLGYPLYRPFFEQAREINLGKDAGVFSGQALFLQITKGRHTPPRDVSAYVSLIESAGGSCAIEFIDEPPGVGFGGPAFVSTNDPSVRVDMQQPMNDQIAQAIREWMPA